MTTLQLTRVESYTLYAYLSSAWVDITADAINNPISASWGLADNKPLTRLAETGQMTFTLENITGKYTPGASGALAGWKKGVPIKLEVVYDSVTYIKFRGFLSDLDFQIGLHPNQARVNVTVLDWMDYAAKFPLLSPGTQTNKTADEALEIIVPEMPIQPQSTSYDSGVSVFPALFDTVQTKTVLMSEFQKLVLSEAGFLYLQHDRDNGEKLVFESNHYRNGLRDLKTVPLPSVDSGFLLMEDGGYLLLEDGGKIILDEADTFVVDNEMIDLSVTYGDRQINRLNVIAYPKRVDTTNQVLYSLPSPMQLSALETKIFRTNYSDPTGGSTITALTGSMVTPVATTDYLANTASDGTGTNITADLTVSAVYGVEGVTYTVTNGTDGTMWITKLQARGFGVYAYNPIENSSESAASIAEYSYQNETLDQLYQRDILEGGMVADKIVELEKNPRLALNQIRLNANYSACLMEGFLNIDVGDLIHVQEDQTEIDGYYYVDSVAFNIAPAQEAASIDYSFGVRDSFSLRKGLTLVAGEFSGSASSGEDCLNFGYLPEISNLTDRTWSAWVYWTDYTVDDGYGILGNLADTSRGDYLYVINQRISFYTNIPQTTPGAWYTDSGYIDLNMWNHIVCVHNQNPGTGDPTIYINNVASTLVETSTPAGTPTSETGSMLGIGNVLAQALRYTNPFHGKIADARIYNRALTSAEVAEIYAAGKGVESVTSGLVFQGPCVRTSELAHYTDLTLTSEDKVLDNIYGAVGTTHDSVITRIL